MREPETHAVAHLMGIKLNLAKKYSPKNGKN